MQLDADMLLEYQEVRDKVVGVAGHKGQKRTPLPREEHRVNEMRWGNEWDWGGEESGDEESGGAVDALGKGNANTSCHRCGGKGHFAR